MKVTNKHKLATFDTVAAERDKLRLVVHDLVNHKFGIPITRLEKDFACMAGEYIGRYAIAMSWRAMPLYLVRYISTARRQDDQVTVLTDNEIVDGYRDNPTAMWWKLVMNARNELVDKRVRLERLKAENEAEGRKIAADIGVRVTV